MTIYRQTRRFIELKGRLSVLKTFLENMPDLDESEKQSIDNIQNLSITIQNMGFYYVPKKYILKNVSLKINQNEKIAIIGEIGSGKSTLGKLLIKLFDYDEGSIKLNNIELKDIEILSLRKIITYIPQHPELFNRTLLSNLTYGSNNIKRETVVKLINSIKIKSIRDVLLTNLDKSVGKYGNNLSGGQRQIVWLIRSILQDSKMIILDEPTSSLDEENKLIVMDFIKSLSKNKTLILITHDMKLLKLVNRVIKFDKGKLIEDNNK